MDVIDMIHTNEDVNIEMVSFQLRELPTWEGGPSLLPITDVNWLCD